MRGLGLISISDCGWAINIFGRGTGYKYFWPYLLGGNLDFWQFGQLGICVTWTLSNLDFGVFGHWTAWVLVLWTTWVTWTFGNFLTLVIGKLMY